jgi:hypothetical protein
MPRPLRSSLALCAGVALGLCLTAPAAGAVADHPHCLAAIETRSAARAPHLLRDGQLIACSPTVMETASAPQRRWDAARG